MATIYATGVGLSFVQAAVNAASDGDTVIVPAGSATWAKPNVDTPALNITKFIRLVGAGEGETVITAGGPYDAGSYLDRMIRWYPSNPALDLPLELTGFTFIGTAYHSILEVGVSYLYSLSKVRIHHNDFQACRMAFMEMRGQLYGCIDNNSFSGNVHIDFYGYDSAWTYWPFSYGSSSQLYFEDNTISTTSCLNTTGIGGRVCMRHNDVTITDNLYPTHDVHGNQPTANSGGMGCEIYENTYNLGGYRTSLFDFRGGMSLVYNNTCNISGAGNAYGNYRETYVDSVGSGPEVHAITGQPQHVYQSYNWGNTKTGGTFGITTTSVNDYTSKFPAAPYVPRPDREYFSDNPSFDGTANMAEAYNPFIYDTTTYPYSPGINIDCAGVGVGLLAARPASCDVDGAGYWATDTETLYRWHDGAWETYYTPYTYPHPLRGEEPEPEEESGSASGFESGSASGSASGEPEPEPEESWSIDDADLPQACGAQLPGYDYRKRITVLGDNVDAALTGFPLYVPFVADTDIGATCRGDGFDIRFTDATGLIELPYERVSFSVVGGAATGEFWVKADLTADGGMIFVYWGDATAGDGSNKTAVWDANFKAVYHMLDNTTSLISDSTANDNAGTKAAANEPVEADGKIAKGQDFDGTNDSVSIPYAAALAPTRITLEAWANRDALTGSGYNKIVSRSYRTTGWTPPYIAYTLQFENGGGNLPAFALSVSDTLRLAISSVGITNGTWSHLVGTFDGTTMRIYLDGVERGTGAFSGNVTYGNNLATQLGMALQGATEAEFADGKIDEVRISSIARSAEWIKFEYANMAEDDNELLWGTIEDLRRNFLKSLSLHLGGAGISTDPIAGTWSAEILNPNGMFHPLHPTSPYRDILRVGREVRISVGGMYPTAAESCGPGEPGVPVYWQRLIGFMDPPRFDHGTATVSLSGMDYAKLLTDKILGDVNPIAESGSGSGAGATDAIINGPTHWGRVAVFDSVASPGGSGAEIYAEADACEIGGGEANNVANWAAGGSGGSASSVASTESNWALRFTRDDPGPTEQYCQNANVGAGVAGNRYAISFDGRISAGENYARLLIYQTVGASTQLIGEVNISTREGVWHSLSTIVTVTVSGAIQMRLTTEGKYAATTDQAEVDNISIKFYDPDTWMRYELPAECNGPYFVTLSGEPIGQGDQEEGGWHYVESTRYLFFSEGMVIDEETDGVRIYYYVGQLLDNVLADILVWSGLYASRANALADMDYTPTGITLGRVWFDSGSTAMAAVHKLCERIDYRFWFDPYGKPHFHPAPTVDAIDFTFTEPGQLQDNSDYQDRSTIRNSVTVEGSERAPYQVGRDDRANDRYKATVEDAASIDANLENTYGVYNHLFQTQTSVNDMAAKILADFKDPKWYSELSLFANPIPLELGHVIAFPLELQPPSQVGLSDGATVNVMGVIRDVEINDLTATYKVEQAEDFWSAGDLPSGL